MEYDNFNNNYIDSNNNNQERNNNIYNREIHANNYKIQSKYNQTQKLFKKLIQKILRLFNFYFLEVSLSFFLH